MKKYYDITETKPPNRIIKYFIENIPLPPTKAIELGCGAGRDTIYLIKNGWNVLAIDKSDVEKRIIKRLNQDEQTKFRFSKQKFEELELEETTLIIANFSLSFCEKNKFDELWNKIKKSILPTGYFVGNIFGINDSWKNTKKNNVFFTKEQVLNLFEDFEIIHFKEIDKDGKSDVGKEKHWHYFNIIARKK